MEGSSQIHDLYERAQDHLLGAIIEQASSSYGGHERAEDHGSNINNGKKQPYPLIYMRRLKTMDLDAIWIKAYPFPYLHGGGTQDQRP